MAPLLRSYDAFAKPIDGIRERSVVGGYITLLALSSAMLLLLSELIVQFQVTTRHSLHLAESAPSLLFGGRGGDGGGNGGGGKGGHNYNDVVTGGGTNGRRGDDGHLVPLRLHVTFPHLDCSSIDYGHDGNAHSSGAFGRYHASPYAFVARAPTPGEYLRATVPGYDEYDYRRESKSKSKSKSKVVGGGGGGGCTLLGTIRVPRVGGTLSVSVSPDAWRRATSLLSFGIDPSSSTLLLSGGMPDEDDERDPFAGGRLPNVTHYVHDLTFGAPPTSSSSLPPGTINPLAGAHHVMDNGSGVALASVSVKLVPTTYVRALWLFHRSPVRTYQASVSRHIVQPETLASQRSNMLPGLFVTYDFTPLAIRHVESRENWLVFLSSLVGIVGGAFVTVSAVSGCLVDSVQAVAKKMD
ncbi:hypothetical protein ACHAXA_000280 [Cyclostephanos tholiformis]|uniref:Uncharacterized protein n=1 Tax=Cyclostephanos tholiformis TaxID=382380 RepID=A0ABD3SB71_9STRA